MNREEYLSELYGRLSNRMPAVELDRVMRYYEEYFDEAGPGREAQVMAELGAPEDLCRQILGDRPNNAPLEYRYESGRRGRDWTTGKIIWVICLFPLWLPLLIGVLAAMFGLVVGIGAGGLGCIGGGILSAWCGFTAIFNPGVTTTMFFGGLGLLAAGLGLAMLAGSIALGQVCCKGVGHFFGWFFNGSKGGGVL